MSDLNRIEQNNAELRECIEIAESLPDAPQSVGGYDIATMQKFVDGRGSLAFFYYNVTPTNESMEWLSQIDTSKVTNSRFMFENAFLQSTIIPLFDVSSVTDASHMFGHGTYPESIPAFHFKQPCNCEYMFSSSGGSKLNDIKVIIDDCTNASNMFSYCKSLTSFPNTIAVSNCKTFTRMFAYCDNLIEVSMDMRSGTSASSMFAYCYKLTTITLKNIKCNLQVGSGTSWGHLLTVDSLVGLCYELRDTGSNKTLTIGAANLAKLASVYVRLVEITDEMRAEDNLIDEKLPFEVCESTDEGATLIADYVILKNWKLA